LRADHPQNLVIIPRRFALKEIHAATHPARLERVRATQRSELDSEASRELVDALEREEAD